MQMATFTFFLSYTSQAIKKKKICSTKFLLTGTEIECQRLYLYVLFHQLFKKQHCHMEKKMRTWKALPCMNSGYIKLNHTHNMTIRIDNIKSAIQ